MNLDKLIPDREALKMARAAFLLLAERGASYAVVRAVLMQDGMRSATARRFIERIAHRDSCVGGLLNVQADCCFSYGGNPVPSVQVPWLPSTSVIVWADGNDLGTVTTDNAGNCILPGVITPGDTSYSNIVVGLGGQVITGSTEPTLPNGNAPGVVFTAVSNTLAVPAAYNGYPCEVFADIGGTGQPAHIGTLTVENGMVTLPNNRTAGVITACLGYVAPFLSAKLAYAAQGGSALTMPKKIDHVGLVMYDTHYQGVQSGQRFDGLDPLPLIEADQVTSSGLVWPEYDEPTVEVAGEWNTDARLCLLAQAPRPCTIGAVVIGIDTNEKS